MAYTDGSKNKVLVENKSGFRYNGLVGILYGKLKGETDMEFMLLAGGLVIILIAVVIAVVSSVVSAVAADQDNKEE